MLGRQCIVRQYRWGLARTSVSRKSQPIEIEISDTPVTTGHPDGDGIMRGLAVHELGHHLYDIGQRGSRAMRGIASIG